MTDDLQRSAETHDRFTQVSGEFTRVYGWRKDEDGNDEPVMVIYRTHYRTQAPFGVPLSAAYRFTSSKHIMLCAFKALDHFGMLTTKDSAIKLATMIQDGLSDLLRMPPKKDETDYQRDDPDAVLTINGQETPVWTN